MKFIHRLKSAVGIGTPTLAIEGVVGPVRPGEVLRGTLVLLGGTYEVPVERVLLHFDEQHLTHTLPSAAAPPDRESRRQVAAAELALEAPVLRSGERIVRDSRCRCRRSSSRATGREPTRSWPRCRSPVSTHAPNSRSTSWPDHRASTAAPPSARRSGAARRSIV
ncbi:hypothetical protein [Nannocystis pusilla]|uniref:hypothetical protein n=1 Tax=Nannocystis pusilla TaxID=889268 RepID=UPI003B77E6F0